MSMEEGSEIDLKATVYDQIIVQDGRASHDTASIYDNERTCFPMKNFKNVLEGLGNYSVNLGKGCDLALERIDSLKLKKKKRRLDQFQVTGSLSA